jgi:oligosaccharide reducing-end xylanase
VFSKVTGPETGLTPGICFDETQVIRQNGAPTTFGYDSWRSVSNWAVDYFWWRKDPREITLSDRIQRFLYGQGIGTFADRYTLDGKPLSTRHSTGMVATAAAGSLAQRTDLSPTPLLCRAPEAPASANFAASGLRSRGRGCSLQRG